MNNIEEKMKIALSQIDNAAIKRAQRRKDALNKIASRTDNFKALINIGNALLSHHFPLPTSDKMRFKKTTYKNKECIEGLVYNNFHLVTPDGTIATESYFLENEPAKLEEFVNDFLEAFYTFENIVYKHVNDL